MLYLFGFLFLLLFVLALLGLLYILPSFSSHALPPFNKLLCSFYPYLTYLSYTLYIIRKLEGAKPLQKLSSPSPFKERGIKGVRYS